jgi:hypothetical protein
MKERTQKYSHINIVNWILTKEQKQYNGEKILFWTNNVQHYLWKNDNR